MITTGSKYFYGITALASIAMVLYMLFVNPNDIGAVALGSLASAAALLGGLTSFTRDSNTHSPNEASAAATQPAPAAVWPLIVAVGVVMLVFGLATNPIVFVLGIVALVAGGAEWLVQDYASRASADSEFNSQLRGRLLHPLEFPVAAAVVVGIIAISFSRIMLNISKSAGAIVFIIVSSLVLVVGFLVALKPNLRGRAIGTLCSVGLIALVGAGIVTGISGERAELVEAAEEGHYLHMECGAKADKYFDKHPNNAVSLKSATLATITVRDGKLVATLSGLDTPVETVTIPRSNPAQVLFRNMDAEEHRLVAELGEKEVAETGVKEKLEQCTQLTGKEQVNVLTLNIPKSSEAAGPYKFVVPGLEGQEIEVYVP